MVDITSFNDIAENEQSLMGHPKHDLETTIPQEILKYANDTLTCEEGTDSFDHRWMDNQWMEGKLQDSGENSFRAMYFATCYKSQLWKLLRGFRQTLQHDGLGDDIATKWKNIILLKTATDMRAKMCQDMNNALNEIENNGRLSPDTTAHMLTLGEQCSHLSEKLVHEINTFMLKNPDPAYDSGKKDWHSLFQERAIPSENRYPTAELHLRDFIVNTREQHVQTVFNNAKNAARILQVKPDALTHTGKIALTHEDSISLDALFDAMLQKQKKEVTVYSDLPEPHH